MIIKANDDHTTRDETTVPLRTWNILDERTLDTLYDPRWNACEISRKSKDKIIHDIDIP